MQVGTVQFAINSAECYPSVDVPNQNRVTTHDAAGIVKRQPVNHDRDQGKSTTPRSSKFAAVPKISNFFHPSRPAWRKNTRGKNIHTIINTLLHERLLTTLSTN